MKCSKHRTYRAVRKPRLNCYECWSAWYLKIWRQSVDAFNTLEKLRKGGKGQR